MCILAFDPSSPSNSFFMLLIHLTFCYILLVIIFCSKIVSLSLHHVAGNSSCHLPLLVGRIFSRCFRISCFVGIVLSCLYIFLIFLLSPVLSGLFPHVIFSFFLMLPFPFCPIFQRFFSVLS